MHLRKLAVRNFRRLHDVVIDLASDISIFVGANNSGKTSVGHALQLFTGKSRFNIHDFNAECWTDIVTFGEGADAASLPSLELDIWFEVTPNDVHRVVDLLPSLSWSGSLVGMRVAFSPSILKKSVRVSSQYVSLLSMPHLKMKMELPNTILHLVIFGNIFAIDSMTNMNSAILFLIPHVSMRK